MGTEHIHPPTDQLVLVGSDLADYSAGYTPLSGVERVDWGTHLRQEACRLITLANRLSPEHARTAIVEGTEMSKLGDRLRQAAQILRAQSNTINSQKKQIEEKDSIIAVQQKAVKEKEDAIINLRAEQTKLMESNAVKDGSISSLKSKAEKAAELQKQLDSIKLLLGEMPDEEDKKALDLFDQLMPAPAQKPVLMALQPG